MIAILVTLLFLCAFIYVVVLIMNQIPIPEPIKQIAYIILGLILLAVLLDKSGLYHLSF